MPQGLMMNTRIPLSFLILFPLPLSFVSSSSVLDVIFQEKKEPKRNPLMFASLRRGSYSYWPRAENAHKVRGYIVL